MGTFSRMQKYTAIILGTAGGVGGIYYVLTRKEPMRQVYNSWTTNTIVSPCAVWDFNWDHRDPKSLVKPLKGKATPEEENKQNEKLESVKPKATRHLLLIRHGQYNLNGKSDVERYLTELGKKQAASTGDRLKSLDISWDLMIRSTMTRAQETGKIISNSLMPIKIENCPLLEEGAPIAPEPPVGHWRPEPSQFFQDGARIEAAYRKYFHRADVRQENDSYTLIVCHANVIRYFVCRALQMPGEAWLRLSLNHASITWISIYPNGRVTLRSLGDSGHMKPEFITRS